MLGELIILDNNKKITARLAPSFYFDYSYKLYLETGAETFDFSVVLTEELEQILTERNYVLFVRNNKYKMFQIMKCKDEENFSTVIRTVEAETVGLELSNSFVRPMTIIGNMTKFLSTVLQDTNCKIGYISPELDNISEETVLTEPKSAYLLIQEAVPTYSNCEFEFDVKPIDSVNGDYELLVNCYADGERGNKTYKRFDYDFNSYGMSRSGDATEFCSGLIGVGANGITFKDVDWDEMEGAPLSKPKGQDFLLDPEAHAMFSNGDKYILGKYTSDATTPIDLLWETYYKLQEVKQVKYSYEIPIYLTDEEYEQIEIGDTCYIVNDKFNPPIQLEARISELELTDGQNKCTFANFKEVKSGIKSLNPNDIMNSVIDTINQSKKLTQSDILALQKYLMDMDIQDEEIANILKEIIDEMDDGIEIVPDPAPPIDDDLEEVDPGLDTENYKTIKINTTDNGLFIGDKRVYDIKDKEVAAIKVEYTDTETETISSSKNAQQYKDALKYYEGFNLGTNKNSSSLSNLISSNNKYKIPTIVKYWAKKFGIDPYLVYAVIMVESSGNPNCATKSSGGGYGIMQCERAAYFNIKQTIKFLDGTTKSFTPSYSTMRPGSGGKTTINGVSVDKNISNQIMFGCNELRKCAEASQFNIFATLMGYNMGMGGVYWCVTHYIKDKYGIDYYGGYSYIGLSKQSSKMKEKYYEVLESHKAPFAAYRKKYRAQFNQASSTYLENCLKWYKPIDGQLPYFLDKKGNKLGYGVNTPSKSIEVNNEQTGSEVRDKIVKMAKQIVSDHVDEKKATYNQSPRTVRYDKPQIWSGTHYGIKNPVAYDCSSLVSCSYYAAGLTSVYNKSCSAGTLVKSATSKNGWKAWKLTTSNLDNYAKPGDIIMVANSTVTDSKIQANPNYCTTYHTIIYCGKVNGKHMIAHASKWAYHPQAIRYESASYYINGGKSFILRPWDLAEADKKVSTSTGADGEIVISKEVIKEKTVTEITLKAMPGASPGDYKDLTNNIVINNVEDKVAFPKTAPYIFLHFGINNLSTQGVQDYKDLIKALLTKYPKKPIFIAKELRVNSTYENYATVNEDIDAFNSQIQEFCNDTKYAIFLDVSKGLVDSNGQILAALSSDGYSFKDKASVDKYYEAVKNAILNISKGQIIDSSSTSITLTAQSQKIHRYTKPVKSLTLKLPSKVVESFYSRLIFTTDSDSVKFTQPSNLYMNGDNCKNGAFAPKKATKYIINIFTNVDDDIDSKYKYYASVTADRTAKTVKQEGYVNTPGSTLNVRKGSSTSYAILGKLKDNTKISIASKLSNGWYKIYYNNGYGYVSGKYVDNIKDVTEYTTDFTNYANFKYRDKLVANAKTFYENRTNFIYNNTCAFDYSNPSENIDKWKTDGKYHIDDNFFTQLCVMGYEYDTCNLAKRTNRNKADGVSWALPYISSESKLARYFVENGWVLDDIDYTNFSNVEPGDILFYDVDSTNNNEFMAISHTAICIGKVDGKISIIEANNGTEAIRIIPITDRSATNLCFVGRINKK